MPLSTTVGTKLITPAKRSIIIKVRIGISDKEEYKKCFVSEGLGGPEDEISFSQSRYGEDYRPSTRKEGTVTYFPNNNRWSKIRIDLHCLLTQSYWTQENLALQERRSY